MQRDIDEFNEALARPRHERAAFIEARHADDPELARRLLRLLDAHERAERDDFDLGSAPEARMTERIGPYRILEKLGEGGMGVVYAAEQTEPFRRRVAVKIIKLGMDTKEVIARFEAERQAMAIMDHPGVAKALDAGVTDEGRPYFVMELVQGLALVEYCAKHRVGLRDRLRLFVEVCAAIQHAHQKGIIHRDLKPSNILVAVQGGRPAPKVIDFGIAKATAARLTDRTIFTERGSLIGTPEYMSPEQAEMSGLDVDTRTDIYSLGVILYELLVGALPFDPEALRGGGYSEILRIIREVDPPRPSARLLELARAPGAEGDDRRARARAVRGELDWIVMRAIDKDRTRRYAAASALGDDVQRHLEDRPVLAGPPSVAYSLQKFVKRHRFATALLALVLLSTAVGVTGLTVGLVRARRAEALAVERAANAQAAADFLERVLFQADPEIGGVAPSLLQIMEGAGRLIDRELGEFPEVEASVRESIGVAYRRRSMFAQAEPHLVRSLELRVEHFGELHLETASACIAMAGLRFEYEGRIDEALELLRRASAAYEEHGWLGSAAEGWLQLDLGIVLLHGDRLGEAVAAFERCRELLARARGPEHPDVSRPVRGLALAALLRGDLDEAERLARHAVALCGRLGAEYIGARAQNVLAQVFLERGQLEAASAVLDDTGSRFTSTVGTEHIRTAERHAILGELHLRMNEPGTAELVSAHCEALRRRLLQRDHWAILEARLLQLRSRIGRERSQAIAAELAEVRDAAARRLGPDHPLSIQVVAAELSLAEAEGDDAGRRQGEQRLRTLRSQRAERLR